MSKAKGGRAKMPWHGDIAHTKLPDGRVVLRGSEEHGRVIQGITEPNS